MQLSTREKCLLSFIWDNILIIKKKPTGKTIHWCTVQYCTLISNAMDGKITNLLSFNRSQIQSFCTKKFKLVPYLLTSGLRNSPWAGTDVIFPAFFDVSYWYLWVFCSFFTGVTLLNNSRFSLLRSRHFFLSILGNAKCVLLLSWAKACFLNRSRWVSGPGLTGDVKGLKSPCPPPPTPHPPLSFSRSFFEPPSHIL